MRSDYFATMISNEKFIEGQNKHIVMKEYGTKKAMESIVEYVCSGKMNFDKLDFETLIEVLNISKMMLMKTDKLSGKIEKYINENQSTSVFSLFQGYLLVERYCLENIRNSVVREIHWDFCTRSAAKLDAKSKEVLQQFSVKLIKEILLYQEDVDEEVFIRLNINTKTRQKFDFFMIWYSENKDCDATNMKIILDSFKLEDFSCQREGAADCGEAVWTLLRGGHKQEMY